MTLQPNPVIDSLTLFSGHEDPDFELGFVDTLMI